MTDHHSYFNSGNIVLLISFGISISVVCIENLPTPLKSQITEDESSEQKRQMDMAVYMENTKFVNTQLMCLLNKAPCDLVSLVGYASITLLLIEVWSVSMIR